MSLFSRRSDIETDVLLSRAFADDENHASSLRKETEDVADDIRPHLAVPAKRIASRTALKTTPVSGAVIGSIVV